MDKSDDVSYRIVKSSKLEQAKVQVTEDSRVRVEFKIQDLIKTLIPGGDVASHCNGCTGCTGCGN
jgi:hypothetical protein